MDLGVSKDKGLLTTDGALFGIHRLISVAWDVESDVISGGGRCWNQIYNIVVTEFQSNVLYNCATSSTG